MKWTTIFFDFGGTLARVPPPFDNPVAVWTTAGLKLGFDLSSEQVEKALEETNRRVGGQIYQYVGRTDDFWRLYEETVLDQLGVARGRENVRREVERTFRDPAIVELYPETRSVLGDLRARGFRTGLISNHHDGLLKVLEYHHLDSLFDSVTYSQEVGAEKPNPAVFSKALQRAGCASSEALHVGDSIEMDVEGARRSGLEPIWIDRARRNALVPCRTIYSLDELLGILER